MVNLELLESNSLSPLVCLDKLTKLRTLSLGYGAKVPNDLRGMRNLVSLSVSTYCCLEEDLQLPLSLRSLDIGFCRNPNQLCGLTNLTTLKFSQAHRVTSECLSTLPQIKALYLHGCDFLIADQSIFRTLSSLTRLDVWCASNITDECLAPLVHLQSLLLSDNSLVTSKGLNALPSLARLALASVDLVIDTSKLKASIKLYKVHNDIASLDSWLLLNQ